MALYTTNFSHNTNGAFPSDWTAEYIGTPTGTRIVQYNSGEDKKYLRLTFPASSSGVNEITFNTAGSSTTVETLVLLKFGAGSGSVGVMHRYNATPNYYSATGDQGFAWSGPAHTIDKVNSGITTSLGPLYSVTATGDTDYFYIRTRISGSSIKTKAWKYGLSEPSFWYHEVTDTSIAGSGKVGLRWSKFYDDEAMDIIVDYFAVGTDGTIPAAKEQTLANLDATLGVSSDAPVVDLPGSEGSVIYGGWGSFFLGSSYAGSASGYTAPELGPYGGTLGISSDNVTLVQDIPLVVQDATIGTTSDVPLPIMDIPIIVQDSTIGVLGDNAEVDATVAVALPNDALVGINSDTPSLQQQHHLAGLAKTAVGIGSETPSLTQKHYLVVNDTVIAVSADTPQFIQDYKLAVEEALVGVGSDNAKVLISFKPGDIGTGEYTPEYEGTAGELVAVAPVAVDQYTPQATTSRVWDEGTGPDTGSWNST